jgi:predicted helicase
MNSNACRINAQKAIDSCSAAVLPIDAVNEAVYTPIPKNLGDRKYWSTWAKSIDQVAQRLIGRIQALISQDTELAQAFTLLLKGLQDTLNPTVSETEVIEMLAQHILTLPVFKALFTGSRFPNDIDVARSLESLIKKFEGVVASETEGLEKFYEKVREHILLAESDQSKQEMIRNLYGTFFQNAFPRAAKRLGIVYTPVPVVDFILQSVQVVLQKHFQCNIGDKGVQILDPFSGAGTFLVRLIQSNLIDKDSLPYKFDNELYAHDIVLLAYYISKVNIETAFHAQMGTYQTFDGMVLTDTFQMNENTARADRQLKQPIRVILGNPPYSAKQSSANDNNQNLDYPALDDCISKTYAAKSNAKSLMSLYDSYVRAIRWASNRIPEKGIVAFVTNGSFIDANNMDGLRQCLVEEYSYLYVFNLRGNQRTSGEESRREGGKVFGSGSRTPVAITLMVKDPSHSGACELRYHDIGDYFTQQEKFDILKNFGSIEGIDWQILTPNSAGDWINQRDPAFDSFIQLGDKNTGNKKVVFSIYSLGISSGRDAWVYNRSRHALESNVRRMLDAFNVNSLGYTDLCSGKPQDQWPEIESAIDTDPKRISWSRALKAAAKRGKQYAFAATSITQSMYRPFTKQYLYFNRCLNEYVFQVPKLFPTLRHPNLVIMATGTGGAKGFSVLASDTIPNLHMHDTGQCFPLYWYEKVDSTPHNIQHEIFSADSLPDAEGYIRREAITDWALDTFRHHYHDTGINREDIFWYVYGLLHSREYKQRFAATLKKMTTRIFLAQDFYAFCSAGRKLGDWHLNYETIEPYPLDEEKKHSVMTDNDYRVLKMVFGKKEGKADKSVIIYNQCLTLSNIPLDAYDYVVNGKSAIAWIMERYQITTDKTSGIQNDPNDWSDDPRYIVDLVKRIVRVSIESVRIVKNLPSVFKCDKTEELTPK